MRVTIPSASDLRQWAASAVTVRPGTRHPNVIFVCEHGGNVVPPAWNDLGLPRAFFDTHFGIDIGAAEVTREAASRLGATSVVANYSRLFLDYNRYSTDPDCFRLDMGGIPIPANLDVTPEEVELRESIARSPVERAIDESMAPGRCERPILVSIHSFSPVWANEVRACQLGVLWRDDARLAPRLIDGLRASGRLTVDDNQPYDFRTENWFTLKRHGLDADVPCAYVEIRNSYLSNAEGIRSISDLVAEAVYRCVTT